MPSQTEQAKLNLQGPVHGRRGFFSGLASLMTGLCLPGARTVAAAEAICGQRDIKASELAERGENELIYWVDGPMPERRHIAFFLRFKQTAERYVSKVVFATAEQATIGVRYYSLNDRLSDGNLPYMVFNDVDLFYNKLYYLIVQVQEGEKSRLLRFSFLREDLGRSSLGGLHLPAELHQDLGSSHGGKVFSPFYLPMRMLRGSACASYPSKPQVCWDAHKLKAYLLAIDPQKNDFVLSIDFPHPDLAQDHYGRYFIATDPVGRILGLTKRSFGSPLGPRVRVQALSHEERTKRWQLDIAHVARIGDCPYIKVFADDAQEGFFVRDIWLR